MSELQEPATAPRAADLLAAITAAVLAVPGVLRLEPTLSSGGPRVLLGGRTTDGVRLLLRAGRADVDVDVATSARHEARAVSRAVRGAVADALRRGDAQPGTIAVTVLSVDVPADGI